MPSENDLEAENERLRAELARANAIIRRAKDINPVQRPSWRRVIKLVEDACMSLERIRGGWLLRMGHLVRRFGALKQIWEILIQEDWYLSDIFPPATEQSPPAARPRLPMRSLPLAPKMQLIEGGNYG